MSAAFDLMDFRENELFIDARGTRFGEVMEPWQRERIFDPLDAVEDDGSYRYHLLYLELPRGHGKTTIIAGEAVTQMVAAEPEWRGHIFAGDKDQARLLFEAVVAFIRRNPVLDQGCTVQRDRIICNHNRATLQVHSSDAPTAHGLKVDWFAGDEFWNQPNRDLWDAFYTAVVKSPNWRGILITTAGYDRQTICWEVRELAQRRPEFYCFSAPGRLASWITDEEMELQRDTLPPDVFQRLHENKWVEGSGSFIDREDLQQCVDQRLERTYTGWPYSRYFIGVDLGLKRDRTAAAILHRSDGKHELSPEGSIVLDDLKVWQGTRRKPVVIEEVEEWLIAACGRFKVTQVLMDPWQAEGTIQKLQSRLPIKPFTFSAQGVSRLSANLYNLIRTARLRVYPDDDLFAELVELEAVQTAYGWRIDHKRNRHDDRAMALGMAALAALDHAPSAGGGRTRITSADVRHDLSRREVAVVGDRVLFIDERGEVASRPRRRR